MNPEKDTSDQIENEEPIEEIDHPRINRQIFQSMSMMEVRLPHERRRKCTDVVCLIIFLVCLFIQALIAITAYENGFPSVLIHPRDSYGQLCGYDEAVKDKPYLLFFDLSACANLSTQLFWLICKTPQICVAECPIWYWDYQHAAQVEERSGIIYFKVPSRI